MLVSFSASNTRSFRGVAELSMARIRRRNDSGQPWDGWEPYSPVACVFGANASGKSNFLAALNYFVDAVAESQREWEPTEGVPLPPRFALGGSNDVSNFELVFMHEGVRHQYGFAASPRRIHSEWLYSFPKKVQRVLFERETHADAMTEWRFGDTLKGRLKVISDLTRENSLFLSAAASYNHPTLSSIYSAITDGIKFANADDHIARINFTKTRLRDDDAAREAVVRLLKSADLGIGDVQLSYPSVDEKKVERFLEFIRERHPEDQEMSEDGARKLLSSFEAEVQLAHVNDQGALVAFPLAEESLGTQALLGLSGPIIDAIENGTVLVVDELDASLHSLLVRALVNVFKSKSSNPHGAQLIFSSHDITLLLNDAFDSPVLDRDQVWFVEKNKTGASEMYPLSEFKVRPSHSLLRGYLLGRYGAVPNVDWRDFAGSLIDVR